MRVDRYNKGPTHEQIGGMHYAGNFDTRSQQVKRYEVPYGTVLGIRSLGLASEVLRTVRSAREVVLWGGLFCYFGGISEENSYCFTV